jgi:hypothetical protein
MADYALKDCVALITDANNPHGIGAATALAFARLDTHFDRIRKPSRRPKGRQLGF